MGKRLICRAWPLVPFFVYRWRTGVVTGLAEKCVHERKREIDGQFLYHGHRLPAVAVKFQADVRLSSIEIAMVANREALGEKQLDPYPSGVILSVLPAAGEGKGDWGFRDMLTRRSTRHEQRSVVLDEIQGLVRHEGFPVPGRGLDVLRLAEYRLCDCLKLIELSCIMSSKRTEAESRVMEIRRLKERVRKAYVDAEALRVERERLMNRQPGVRRWLLGLTGNRQSVEPQPIALADWKWMQRRATGSWEL